MRIRVTISFQFGESTYMPGDVADLPSLSAKAAIAAGKAEPADEVAAFDPETIADQVNNANRDNGKA